MSVSVLLVDDHPIVRTGLRALFDGREDVEIVGEAGTGEEAVAVARMLGPRVVLCDLRLGDGWDGVATTTALRTLDPAPAVIILTTYDRDADILRAIEAGAAGYLLKDVSTDTIVRAIRQAAAGQLVLAPEMAERVALTRSRPRVHLTEREQEVLGMLGSGASNREIARSLFVTEATVKTHLVNLFAKLQVESRAKAVSRAQEQGLI